MENTVAIKKYLNFLALPSGLQTVLLSILPIVIAQMIQKIYPIVDNHYIGILGSQALLIHNIQYSFISLGQYIGSATAISCLIFWKRLEYLNKQKGILVLHLMLCLLASSACALIALNDPFV